MPQVEVEGAFKTYAYFRATTKEEFKVTKQLLSLDQVNRLIEEAAKEFPETEFWQTMTDLRLSEEAKEKVMDEYAKIFDWWLKWFGDPLKKKEATNSSKPTEVSQ